MKCDEHIIQPSIPVYDDIVQTSSLYTNPQQPDLSTKHAINFVELFVAPPTWCIAPTDVRFHLASYAPCPSMSIAVGFRWRDPSGVKGSLGNLCWNGEVARGSEFVHFRFPPVPLLTVSLMSHFHVSWLKKLSNFGIWDMSIDRMHQGLCWVHPPPGDDYISK